MSAPINDGGPAFPCHGISGAVFKYGMSLHDYFAAAALTGLLANPKAPGREEVIVDAAFHWADEMLKKHEMLKAREAQP
jgi:hypothetical protein